jgi:hypothetical protein
LSVTVGGRDVTCPRETEGGASKEAAATASASAARHAAGKFFDFITLIIPST